jgi:decaprenyl-phosphate phosphoribosyltransferase
MLIGILKSMRPHQWIKNAFVLAPLVFASAFDQPDLVLRALAAFLAFSLTAGGVYLFNDIVDVDKDRAHPTKRNRPVAAGRVSIPAARIAAALALASGIGGAWTLNPATGIALTSYLAINVAYSARLKHIAYVDLVVIATGFVIRVLAGGFATGIAISLWLILCTFLLALFLGLGKRRHELLDAQTDASQTRRVLRQYQARTLSRTMATTALLTICAYTAYTFSEHGADVFGTAWAPLSVPFCVFGIVRFYVLTGRTDTSSSPTDRMLTDLPFMANLLAWGVLVLVWLSRR